MNQYEVGTVLWIIRTDRPGLVAYRVVEEITKRTLEGEAIQYLVQPALPKGKTVKLETIKGKIFLSSEEAKNAMIENASRAIDVIVSKTENLIQKVFYGGAALSNAVVAPTINTIANQSAEDLKEGYQWVTMEDGKKVQVRIPESLL